MIKILYNFFNAVKNNLEILENLLAYQKIDLNIQSADGYTALMVAARWGESEIVEKFLASGANSNTQNAYYKESATISANSCKIGFDAHDQFLLGPKSVGAYLFVNPNSHIDMRVNGDDAISYKDVKFGNTNALTIPVTLQNFLNIATLASRSSPILLT